MTFIKATDRHFYRKNCRMSAACMSSRAINIPSVHVKNDVGGISMDDKVTHN